MIKAAFFDVDGTLLSHKTKQVPPSARAALAKLQAQGVLCIVATGRHIGHLMKLPVADIPFDAYLTLNGQMMLDKDQNLLFSVPITGKVKNLLLKQFEAHAYPALIVEEKSMYLNYVSDHVREVNEAISTSVAQVGSYQGGEIYQVCAYLRPEEEHLVDPIAENCVLTRWHCGGMDIIAKGGGKMAGIKRYLGQIGIAPEEIIAFGDGENDLDMIRFAGIGVAMGNGVESVKAVADFVTADIDDDGIDKALRHYNLI